MYVTIDATVIIHFCDVRYLIPPTPSGHNSAWTKSSCWVKICVYKMAPAAGYMVCIHGGSELSYTIAAVVVLHTCLKPQV